MTYYLFISVYAVVLLAKKICSYMHLVTLECIYRN